MIAGEWPAHLREILENTLQPRMVNEVVKGSKVSKRVRGEISERDLVLRAWREFQESLARGCPGLGPDDGRPAGVNESLHAMPNPPRWFVDEELGFRLDCGPSLRWTCESLARANRAALKLLAESGEGPPARVTWPRDRR